MATKMSSIPHAGQWKYTNLTPSSPFAFRWASRFCVSSRLRSPRANGRRHRVQSRGIVGSWRVGTTYHTRPPVHTTNVFTPPGGSNSSEPGPAAPRPHTRPRGVSLVRSACAGAHYRALRPSDQICLHRAGGAVRSTTLSRPRPRGLGQPSPGRRRWSTATHTAPPRGPTTGRGAFSFDWA
jgi:hypothetical protein